jgi:D-lactate dehydrogenase (cytochrome)
MQGVHTTTDQDVIAGYLTDASNTTGHAECLAIPRTADEVAAVVRHCQANSIPLTVTAQRTSTTGGPVPHGGWLLSMEALSTVHASDDVDGGVILGEHQDELERTGKLFPPDPTSRHECTVGAAIACNASGARSFRYGPTRPWIEAVQVVLPTGDVIWADRSTPIPSDWPTVQWDEPDVKTAAGFFPASNLLDLMIGQEGALGIITRARLRLVDAPADVLGLIVFFPDLDSCLSFVDRARVGAARRGQAATPGQLDPRAIEYFDHNALVLARERVPDIPQAAHAALFIEIEHDGEPPLDDWWMALLEAGALADDTIVADDPSGRKRLHAVRHAIPAGVNEMVVANGMPKVGTDFAVPDDALSEMMAAYADVEMPSVCFGHIGDNHLHLNFLPRTEDELVVARAEYRRLALQAVSLGGTVSAEHGIGKIKRGLLAEMVGKETLDDFVRLKRHIDPAWILGRGTMIDQRS